ncbi:MAG: glycosyltransferase family 2 protein, partial [Burkholderiales bacterium]
IDDGCTDESAALIKPICEKDRRLQVISQENRGLARARNRGLAQVTGEFVIFLDADDYWAPMCIEKLYQAVTKANGDLAYCGWQNIGLPGGRGEPFVPPDYAGTDKIDVFLGGCRWPIHAALVRRQILIDLGGFPGRWNSCEDYYVWLNLAPFHKIVRVPEVLAYYRHHEGPQITKNRLRIATNHWLIQREFIATHRKDVAGLARRRLRELTHGELLRRGYVCYWQRDLATARPIFRKVMQAGYGTPRDWIYMLPALLPMPLHRLLIKLARRR